jgi:L-malate glycosyltransferase
MSTILHITYDYGDPTRVDKTTAVLNLVNQTRRISDALVFDLSRTTSFKKEYTKKIREDHIKINSFGLPLGLSHRYQLERVNKKIIAAAKEGLFKIKDISIVHAHKLTFDGYIGYLIASGSNKPLFITLRQTDFWVLKYRPDLKRYYNRVLIYAKKIFYLVPSMIPLLKETFGENLFKEHIENKLIYLPNIINTNAAPVYTNEPDAPLITILRINKSSVKRKNLRNLLRALGEMDKHNFRLKIIGSGNYLPKVKSWVNKYHLSDKVTFTGQIPNNQINEQYAKAKAFVMPSFSESFGLVYAEALLNGTPILYSKGVLGFEGVFENVGSAVDPNSIESIKSGIIDLLDRNEFYRNEIHKLHENGSIKIFSPEYALKTYKKAYDEVYGGSKEDLSGSIPKEFS